MIKLNWIGKHVLIIGAARQGLALGRYLAEHGAKVILTDNRPESQMQEAVASLANLEITWALGGHPLSLLEGVDLVCLSGGIPLTLPIVLETIRRRIPLSNDTEIFMAAVPCKTIGITGSAGKTTTTTLLGRMAEHFIQAPHKSYVGGNIGLPLINFVDEMTTDDLVILEISSFQLEQMTHSPDIAAVLNITPNHLDRHGTMEAYTAAKARILQFQGAQSVAILNREDPGAWGLAGEIKGHLVTFGLAIPPAGMAGTYITDDMLYISDGEHSQPIMPRNMIRLRGEHNLISVLAACAIAYAAGMPPEAMRAGVVNFTGVAHRLEFVTTYHGADWYNDSIATAPERVMAAIHSFDEPLVLMVGGRDKKLPWEAFASIVHQRVDHLVVFGEAAEKILSAVGPARLGSRPYSISHCSNLKEAVQAAAEIVEPGDVVLLSPGGTSFDEFQDFEERGEYFRKWVKQLL